MGDINSPKECELMDILKKFIRRPKVTVFLIFVAISIFMNVVLGIAPPGNGDGSGP